MDANSRAKVLALPGMRTICDFVVNCGNKRYVNAAGVAREDLLNEITLRRSSNRCFIVGSGPSLSANDLDLIAGEDSFAANHIFKVFDSTNWRPKFYVLQDRYTNLELQLSQIECEYMFLGSYFLRNHSFVIPNNAFPFYDRRDLGHRDYLSFSQDILRFISVNYTVTYTMIQIAYALGYSEVYLIGIDHSYAVETDDKGAVVKRNTVRNHAYDDKQEVVANIAGMNRAYLSAKKFADSQPDFSIYNSTRGGRLEVFPRVTLEEVLKAH